MSNDYDSPWKEILDLYFPQFMAFFFPDAHDEIDWARGYESLEQELREVVRDSTLGTRYADKLMRVWKKNGEEHIVYVHVEIQGERDDTLAKRVFVYNYRIYDRFEEPVVSLAVLCDASPSWRPKSFGWDLWGCEVGIRFPVVKLRDYNEGWDGLQASSNPFAVVVMAHLKSRATRSDPVDRLSWKTRLVRQLYRGGYGRQDVLELFRFIDWVLALPEGLEKKFRGEVQRFEEELKMPYVTSIERLGRAEGRAEGQVTLLRRQLVRRFVDLPAWVDDRLAKAKPDELESWAERVLDAQRLEEVFG